MMRTVTMVIAALAMAGCASQVVTDYDTQVAFDRYSSWAFSSHPEEKGFKSLDSRRVESVLERELAAKNLSRQPEDQADLLVSYQVIEQERLDSYGFSYGVGFSHRPFGWGIATAPPTREVIEGKLVVELVDRSNEQVVWRAASKRYLNEDQSPDYRSELIDDVVREMFNQYPPQMH
ncbi:DUF4136 domain-containing protein [Marinobacter xestospongiae]|uniref:DUF4136 domain-containing protein n=1 Tax=Marinobacter xestospongiae TaxID=994319 RepID=A0ABU3VUC2_9GAMM|nr:DUF4136 domain-containing protein [Marinobacter xestospongiae]MDV2077859.1 DUF4136 domain-containing protein [Marinobacter xestospongiae]